MRFLIDNSVSPRLAQMLTDAGHDAIHIREVDSPSQKDEVIFDRAAADDRILIAMDTDFGTLLAMRHSVLPSVVIFRRRGRSALELFTLLTANLPAIGSDLRSGAVVVFEDTRIRVRRLPIL